MQLLRNYLLNTKKVVHSHNNPLKKIENINKKNRLEREFYDKEAERYLNNFDEKLFKYDENEFFPNTHSFFYSLFNDISGKRILDCCCGHGFTSVKLAKRGAIINGIDISPKMIDLSKRNAEFNDISDNICLEIMSVEQMKFEDSIFDYVVGIGALHHLNIEHSSKEISRVLKKGGEAVFIEPRIPFALLIYLRSLLPIECLESPGGNQLKDKDIKIFAENFSDYKINHFIFLRKFARFSVLKKYTLSFENFDNYIIRKIPALKKFYWANVLEFIK